MSHAVKTLPIGHICGVAFDQVHKGVGFGNGWNQQYVRVEAQFARLSFQISSQYDTQTVQSFGSMELQPEQATELALAIAPPEVAAILAARDQVVTAMSIANGQLSVLLPHYRGDVAHGMAAASKLLSDALAALKVSK